MTFGETPTHMALGHILAHSTGGIRKGTTLTQDHLDRLIQQGFDSIITAHLAPTDLHENDAAGQLADALAARDIRIATPATGRVNLYAQTAGLLRLDTAAITQLNLVNPMITLATLPHNARVAAGTMIATVKIISYGVAAADIATTTALGANALTIARPRFKTAALIETQFDMPPSEKGRTAIKTRLSRLDVTLAPRILVPHTTQAIARAIGATQADIILILTASATSDSQDVAPTAVRQAGGVIDRYGMPVDPGNLLFLGSLDDTPIIGLPGCARSPALNGADWVLEQVICGHPPTAKDIAAMGIGGLLKDIPQRGRPRE
ncbi:molybdopterin-binding protein [Nereida sp. MMG025]|uniref:molybdopterin-binding protein n=1 Tax=Nereida sp. MMG025 TaxID=2909981 RepID=UPI001F22F612|nr:molybdopterin-binding protein [Nereida sp. MMG025]MCF6445356.1 molybdopterin-binding protein [Nereida sp. MMG025]